MSIIQLDLVTGRLKKEPSYIDCSSISTVEKKLVVKIIGNLTAEALARVENKLRNVFGL